MSVCTISCSISIMFIIGMIYFYHATSNSEVLRRYKASLSDHLQERYKQITSERRDISIKGYVLGFILSIIIIYINSTRSKLGGRVDTVSLFCIVVSTCFVTNYFYYILSPKSDSMLNYLKNPDEVAIWKEMYREMQVNYHMGLVLGIIGVGVLSFNSRC